jgi:hypothetical protein
MVRPSPAELNLFVGRFVAAVRHQLPRDIQALRDRRRPAHSNSEPRRVIRDYIRRFNECGNTIPKITDASVIRAFKSGVRDRYTTQELATRRITSARKLFEIIDRCAHADDALRRKEGKSKVGNEKKMSTDKDAPE